VLDVARRSEKGIIIDQVDTFWDDPQTACSDINKPQRSLNEEDLLEAMIQLQGSSEAIFGKR
jgi:hypothetical protein